MAMLNPVHPGRILKNYLEGGSVAELAEKIGVTRQTLHRILACKASITAPVALRLEKAGINDGMLWLRIQAQYDFAQAKKAARSNARVLKQAA